MKELKLFFTVTIICVLAFTAIGNAQAAETKVPLSPTEMGMRIVEGGAGGENRDMILTGILALVISGLIFLVIKRVIGFVLYVMSDMTTGSVICEVGPTGGANYWTVKSAFPLSRITLAGTDPKGKNLTRKKPLSDFATWDFSLVDTEIFDDEETADES